MFNRRLFEAHLVLAGISKSEMASILGIDVSTFSRKLKNDGDFTRTQINKMIEVLDIEEPSEVFFAENIAETQKEGC